MKLLLLTVVVAFAATNVLAQNPYEYVDDALLAKVGEIIFNYDQKVAASRAGGKVRTQSNQNNYYQQQVQNSGVVGGLRSPQQFNNQYQNNYRQNNYASQQNVYSGVQRQQRQYNFGQQQTYAQPRVQQQPQVAPRVYQQPQVHQQQASGKNSFGYVLSQPEPVEMVAEFHFTDGESRSTNNGRAQVQQQTQRFDVVGGTSNIESNRFRFA